MHTRLVTQRRVAWALLGSACALQFAVTAHAAEFLVELKANAPEPARAALRKDAKVLDVKLIPSLGKGFELWNIEDNPARVEQMLSSSDSVSLHSEVTSDYRNLFQDVAIGADLAPDVAQAFAAIQQRPTTAATRLVQLKPDALNARILTNGFDQSNGFSSPGSMRLNLFPGTTAVVTRRNLVQHSTSAMDWSGTVVRIAEEAAASAPTSGRTPPSVPKGAASLSLNGGNIIGRVNVGADTYTIAPLGRGMHAITKINPSKVPEEHPPSQKNIEYIKSQYRQAPPNAAMAKNADGTVLDVRPSPIIRVGIAYTRGAAAQLAAATTEHFADALVTVTNSSYENSDVRARLMLAGTTVIDFAESDFQQDLDRLKTATDGPLGALKNWRKEVGANVLVLIVTLDRYCGLAGAILASTETAYALVSQSCALDNLSFAHEIGHLQGARHNEEMDPETSPFRYGHGYRYKSLWRTIMAYNCDTGCNRLPYWANPNVKMNGVPMGTSKTNHDARVLSETADLLHGFKP